MDDRGHESKLGEPVPSVAICLRPGSVASTEVLT